VAIYQGTPLPRTRTRQTGSRPAAPLPRPAARPPVPVRTLSRPTTPARGSASPIALVAREEPAAHVGRLRTIAAPRPRTALAGVAVVLVVTFVGMFYLSQVFEAAAARYEVDRLLVDRQAMLQELQSQQGATHVQGSESIVTQWAQATNLQWRGSPYRVPAR